MHLRFLKNKSIFLILGILLIPFLLHAQSVDELENKIDQASNKIEEINKDIQKQEAKVKEANKRTNSLQGTVNSLKATENKLSSDIKYTETNIIKTELTIQKISVEIDNKTEKIDLNSEALGEALRRLDEFESTSLLEILFGHESMSDFWIALNNLENFQDKVRDSVYTLKVLNGELTEKKVEETEEKEVLETTKVTLGGKKEAVAHTKKQKDTLLAQTKNEESEYKKVLAEKVRIKDAFEQELLEFESQLQVIIDPDGFQKAKSGIFGWPVSNFIITQRFGGTAFAKRNTHIYGRAFHNGMDFGVPIGTPVKTVSSGVVKGTDNTDAYPGCNSWGKWILVEHDNGLSTMYAHLSSVTAKIGQRVEQGQVIAYSGTSGISTGPHLHLSLYINQGVNVINYREVAPSSYGCGAYNVTIPAASLDSYLDPMEYLPKL
ncbi:MAG: murein DD-endopeptidase MepM/ murein hydrolase activator NlpD [Candidatus Paceibacteria bacterium]|jgi:murein DD-endopeptidase MepM/ murein hydrolase activator NlpD